MSSAPSKEKSRTRSIEVAKAGAEERCTECHGNGSSTPKDYTLSGQTKTWEQTNYWDIQRLGGNRQTGLL